MFQIFTFQPLSTYMKSLVKKTPTPSYTSYAVQHTLVISPFYCLGPSILINGWHTVEVEKMAGQKNTTFAIWP